MRGDSGRGLLEAADLHDVKKLRRRARIGPVKKWPISSYRAWRWRACSTSATHGSPHFAPDLAGWRRERMPTRPAGAISVVPDWVCGIFSPTTRRHDHLVKMPFYAWIGVAFAWLVDAESRLVFAHRLDAGEWRPIGTYSDEVEARIPPFDAAPLNIAAWWMATEESSP
ncbi:MAG TPA: Uma2 family endonuclease [Kofleriaceae bacterium]|nr:Uma2 family endonuclease [Kofleriaceae bacterium]